MGHKVGSHVGLMEKIFDNEEFVLLESFFDTDTDDVGYQIIVDGVVEGTSESFEEAVKKYVIEVFKKRYTRASIL